MSATITWQIQYMQVKPQDGTYSDVVITAGWACNGVQVENEQTYNGSVYSTCSFPMPGADDPNFTPYDKLTEQQVLGWCWENGVDKDSAESAVQSMIDLQIKPVVITPPLPWQQQSE